MAQILVISASASSMRSNAGCTLLAGSGASVTGPIPSETRVAVYITGTFARVIPVRVNLIYEAVH